MPPKKQPSRKPKPGNTSKAPQSTAEQAKTEDLTGVSKIIEALMDWYLLKLNGDQETEWFDTLLIADTSEGLTTSKFALGNVEESIAKTREMLETDFANCHRYAYAWRGYWQSPEGTKYDGALIYLESQTLIPGLYGIEIGPDSNGKLHPIKPIERLQIGDWSLLHRSNK
jgi:hypothetical protein